MELEKAPLIVRQLLSDIGEQPSWRGDAAVDMAWRDNKQWTKEQVAYLESLGLTPLMVNLMAPAMDSVTGYEAKHRVDWMVSGAAEEHDDMAEGINHELNDEMRLAKANHACSEAYESQAGVGIGWVHVKRNTDPLSPNKLCIEDIHRDEMFWDMRSRSEDLRTDCRWVARRKFFDKDVAKVFLGKEHEELIDFTFSDWQTIDIAEESPSLGWYSEVSNYTDPIDLIMDNTTSRPRVAIYQVYYKQFEHKDLIISHNGSVAEFRRENPSHLEILVTGSGYIEEKVPINVCRVAWFVGCHMIYDGPTNEPHNHFPFVPFFGPREDAGNVPYGLLRRMRGAQEQYNRAIVEIQRILRTRRIEKDHDALHKMSDQQAIFEINRTDGVINKKHGREFQVIREWEKIAVLEGICQRSREEINASSGIYQTFQGQGEGDQSGIAVESIAELGAQSLGKINANYQLARKLVGDLAFAHIVDDIGVNRRVVNIPQDIGQQKKQIILNDGINNRVPMLRAQVAMQDIHTSAGYKQHTHQRLTTFMEKLPEQFIVPFIPLWLESADIPKKEQALKMFNKIAGYEQDEVKREQQEMVEAQEAQEQRQLEIRKFVADIEETEAGAEQKKAQATNHMADALKKRIETAQLIRDFKQGRLPQVTGTVSNKPRSLPDQQKALPPGASGGNKPQTSNAPA